MNIYEIIISFFFMIIQHEYFINIRVRDWSKLYVIKCYLIIEINKYNNNKYKECKL
jgi:hypothetical protein